MTYANQPGNDTNNNPMYNQPGNTSLDGSYNGSNDGDYKTIPANSTAPQGYNPNPQMPYNPQQTINNPMNSYDGGYNIAANSNNMPVQNQGYNPQQQDYGSTPNQPSFGQSIDSQQNTMLPQQPMGYNQQQQYPPQYQQYPMQQQQQQYPQQYQQPNQPQYQAPYPQDYGSMNQPPMNYGQPQYNITENQYQPPQQSYNYGAPQTSAPVMPVPQAATAQVSQDRTFDFIPCQKCGTHYKLPLGARTFRCKNRSCLKFNKL